MRYYERLIHTIAQAMQKADESTAARRTFIFNRSCSAITLIYVIIISCLHGVHDSTAHDYPQYHLAGSIAAAGQWEALYPNPIAGGIYNAGFWKASIEKTQALDIARHRNIDPVGPHYMQPPPVALLLLPLGWIATELQGYQIWILLSALAVWFAAATSARLYERCAGRRSCWCGILMLVIVICPLTSRAIFVANVSTFIAVSIGYAVLSLNPEMPSPATAASAIVFSSMVKYAGLLFLPIVFRQRAWRTVLLTAAIALTWILLALFVMGTGPFEEYVSIIVPTLRRSHEYSDNISLAGVMLRIFHQRPPLPGKVTVTIEIFQSVNLLVILFLIWKQQAKMSITTVAAASTALISWLLIYSPITWSHYLVYLYPIWGWILWAGQRSTVHAAVAFVAIGTVVASLPTEPPVGVDPVGVRFLIGLFLTMALAVESLAKTSRCEKELSVTM